MDWILCKCDTKKKINIQLKCCLIIRMWVSWLDKRYMEGNQHRRTDCQSNHVSWNKRNEFWLPTLLVGEALELVSYLSPALSKNSISKVIAIRDIIWKIRVSLGHLGGEILPMILLPDNLN